MKLKFFGITQDIVGKTEIEINLSENTTILTLQNLLMKDYPKLKDLKKFAFAINEEYASPTDMITDTDTVAIIPPVSGG